MKRVINWAQATVADIESDNLLEKATKIHVLSYKMAGKGVGSIEGTNAERLIKFFNYHIDNEIPLVMHNGICFDIPLAEKLLEIDLSKLMVIDTLGISWYLNIERKQHGLDSFFEDYGIAKPKIDDWENLTYEEYLNRCEEDVKINTALWEDLMSRLIGMYTLAKTMIDDGRADGTRVEGEVCYIDQYKHSSSVEDYVNRIISFLCHKMDIARLKEKTRFKADEEAIDQSILELEELIQKATVELEGVMPKVAKYAPRKAPKEPYKKNGELSASGKSWNGSLSLIGKQDDGGNDLVKVIDKDNIKILSKYEPPNIDSHQQIKDFLFTKGWQPENFKFETDEEAKALWAASGYKPNLKPQPRKIPQINIDGENGKELCPSVVRLAEETPEVMAYAKYSVIKHRYGVLKGFKRDMSEDGYLKARNGGFTNTLREQHRELVNLISANKPFGKYIRGALIAEEGKILCGSDMSSLEDRVKHMFMIPHDPDYVATMTQKGYDPHLKIAVAAKLMTEEEEALYKELKGKDEKTADEKKEFERLGKIRQTGKSGNYACQYGSGAETLARTAKVDIKLAKSMVEGYKKLNWSIQAIADEQCVITCKRGLKWLVNPINGFLYSIRSDKDRFSTLCQGTGSYFFDIWVDNFLNVMQEKWGVKRLNGTFHDELVTSFKDTDSNQLAVEALLKESVEMVNKEYSLRRQLGVDVQFGYRYSDIH